MRFAVFFVILLLLPIAWAATASTPELQVTLLSQSPDPVEPGQTVKVKFKIENEGVASSVDNIVKIMPKFPFTLYGDEAEKNIGKLRAQQTGSDAAIVDFTLKVDETAVEGDIEIELMVKVGPDSWVSYTEDEFTIDIQTQDAVLDIVSVVSEPERIAPGQEAEIQISVKNLADSLLKDIKFKLDFNDISLAPYQSSSERRISQLQSGFQKAMTFNVIADPEATPGLVKIPMDITYNDEKGNSYSVDDVLAVMVGETPKITAYIKQSTVLQANKEGKVTVEIANSGTTDIKFMELELLPSDDYQLVSTSSYFYLGDVDSDDTESEEIDIFINRGVEEFSLPIKLSYYDANNKQYQQQYEIEMQLYSSSELKKFGVIQANYSWIFFLIVILGIGGYIYYRKYHKKKK